MAEKRQKDLDGLPVELALSIMVPIFKGKCDSRAVKLLEHGMKMVEMVFERAT